MIFNIMKILDGSKAFSYDDTEGLRTVGVGFNMDQHKAKDIWIKLNIKENFEDVYNKKQPLSDKSSKILFDYFWNTYENKVIRRCKELNINYHELREFHKFILCDICYNTGSVSSWSKVFTNDKPQDIIYEARRNPKNILDSRVAKIAYQFGLINSIDEARKLGLEYTKYIK